MRTILCFQRARRRRVHSPVSLRTQNAPAAELYVTSPATGPAVIEVVPAPGDLDGDGVVGILDLLILLAAWGPCETPCPAGCLADIDANCTVNVLDLLILLANWG